MQNDFIDGALGSPQAQAIVEAVKRRIDEYDAEGETVVFTLDTHGEDYLQTQEGRLLPVPHCVRGTHGWLVSDKLPIEGHVTFEKPTFGSTELAQYAQRMNPQKIELVGLCTDICVITNALLLKSFLPETEVCVNASCCAGVTPESHSTALEAMRMCQVIIV